MITTPIDVVLRTSIIYVSIIIGFRILGKNHLSQITLNDFVLVLLISNGVQNAMVGDNNSVIGGLSSAGTLLVLSYILSKILFSSNKIRKIFEGEQVILIHDGRYVKENLQKVEMSIDELEAVIREHGVDSIKEVHSAILENDGAISIVPKSDKGERPKIYKTYRKKSKRHRFK
ncbi:MAG: DUF421 domain-containing protein, partial [Candidatus Sericytochromatia bacterium]|nr:DUF421 domain-containing protein [Candidatus Sericytochromatia bacterium]